MKSTVLVKAQRGSDGKWVSCGINEHDSVSLNRLVNSLLSSNYHLVRLVSMDLEDYEIEIHYADDSSEVTNRLSVLVMQGYLARIDKQHDNLLPVIILGVIMLLAAWFITS